MSEAPDPLEAELSALRPEEITPEMRRRIAQGLADAPPAKRRWGWRLVFAGGLAAACLAGILFWWASGRREEPPNIAVQPRPGPPRKVEDSNPTLLAYKRAFARSPDELNALLDKQAVTAPECNPEVGRIGAFTRSEAALHSLLGDD
jgi:hypothetical protein